MARVLSTLPRLWGLRGRETPFLDQSIGRSEFPQPPRPGGGGRPPMESGSTTPGSHPGSRANSCIRAWTAPGHSCTTDPQTTTCPRIASFHPLDVLLDLKGKTKIWQVGPGGCSWPTVLFSRATKQAGGCPAADPKGLGGDPLFSLHYICRQMVPPDKSQAFSPHPDPKS